MATLAKLFVELGLNPDGFNKGIDSAIGRAKKAGGQLRKVGLGMSAAFTAPAIATGAALLKVGSDFDSLQDTIRVGTGATGEELKGLTDIALNVFKSIPTSMDAVGIAITDLQQRTGATGVTLEDLTRTQLELARVTGTDLKGNIEATSQAFEQWGVNVNDQSMYLDQLFRTTQATGVPVATLASQLSQYGPILRQMGFGIDESIALLGTLGKAGLDVGTVITGMRTAFKNFTEDGVTDTNKALQDVFTRIKNAPNDLAAGQLAIDTFGSRAGPALAESIRSGKLEYQDLLDIVLNGKDTILDAAADTNDLAENWRILKNRITVAVLPIATRLFNFLNEKGIPALTTIAGKVETLVTWFMKLPAPVKIGIALFGAVLAAIGPVLIVLGTLIPMITTVIAAFSAGGLFAAGGALAFLGPLLIPLALITAAIVLLAIVWKKNLFGIQDITKRVFGAIVDFIQPAIDAIVSLGTYFYDVATNKIQPGNLAKLPKWLQPIAYVLGRLIKTVRVFWVTWQKTGSLGKAFKTLSVQIRALGRSVANLFDKMGLHRFAKEVKRTFDDLASLFNHIVDLVSHIANGEWRAAFSDLTKIAIDLLHLFIDRFRMIGALLIDVFEAIPWSRLGSALWSGLKAAFSFLVTTGLPWIALKGLELLGALLTSFNSAWENDIKPWLIDLPGNVVNAVGEVGDLLSSKGRQVMRSLWHAARGYWDDTVQPWLLKLPGRILSAFDGANDLLKDVGNDIIEGLSDGISFGWNWLMGWLPDLPWRIANTIFSGALAVYNSLWSAGHYIFTGLYDGMKWVWDNIIAPFLGSVSAAIPGLKGPLPKDRVMLKPAGLAIMQGLNDAIASAIPDLHKTIGKVNATIMGTGGRPAASVGTPRLSAMPAVAGAGGGGSANRSVTFAQGAIVVNGAGHDPELIAEMTAKKIVRKIQSVQAGAVS